MDPVGWEGILTGDGLGRRNKYFVIQLELTIVNFLNRVVHMLLTIVNLKLCEE